jgi:Holliday junction DNA helicase RuvA
MPNEADASFQAAVFPWKGKHSLLSLKKDSLSYIIVLMFNSLTGIITAKLPQTIYLQTEGLEWDISIPDTDLDALPSVSAEAKIYTWLYHKEDAMKVFGFATAESRSVFLDLLKVDGVGPKAALKILSNLAYANLVKALDEEDMGVLESVSGIGKKTAQKMMLSLKGKLTLSSSNTAGKEKKNEWEDVITALTQMGYEKKSCEEVIVKISTSLDPSLPRSAKEEFLFRNAIVELAQ